MNSDIALAQCSLSNNNDSCCSALVAENDSKQKKKTTFVIVCSVLGGLLFLGIIGFAIFVFLRKKRAKFNPSGAVLSRLATYHDLEEIAGRKKHIKQLSEATIVVQQEQHPVSALQFLSSDSVTQFENSQYIRPTPNENYT
jgi:hypothetical protein